MLAYNLLLIPKLPILIQNDINAGSFSIPNKTLLKRELELVLPLIIATILATLMQKNNNADSFSITNSNLCASPVSDHNMVEARACIGTLHNTTNSSAVKCKIKFRKIISMLGSFAIGNGNTCAAPSSK